MIRDLLAMTGLLSTALAYDNAPRRREPVWVGRKRPSSRWGRPFFERAVTGTRAPAGYGFDRRGDLRNLRRIAK